MWFAAAVAALVGAVIVHAIATRVAIGTNSLVSFVAAGGIAGLTLLAVLLTNGVSVSQTLATMILYLVLCEVYVFLFTLVMTSVSVGLLLTLRHGSIAESDLDQSFNAHEMVDARLERLTTNGLLLERDGTYVLTARAQRLTQTFNLLRLLFGHERPASPQTGPISNEIADQAKYYRSARLRRR